MKRFTKKFKKNRRQSIFIILDYVTFLGFAISFPFRRTLMILIESLKLFLRSATRLFRYISQLFHKFLLNVRKSFILLKEATISPFSTPIFLGIISAFIAYLLLINTAHLFKTRVSKLNQPILIYDRNNILLYKTSTHSLQNSSFNSSNEYKRAPYAVDYVLSKIERSYADEMKSGKGLIIKTSIDIEIQNFTQQKIVEQMDASITKDISNYFTVRINL